MHPDPEIAVMERISRELEGLSVEARTRILRYLLERGEPVESGEQTLRQVGCSLGGLPPGLSGGRSW